MPTSRIFPGRFALAIAASWLLVAPPLPAREPWLELKNCRLLTNESNDADSFHVKAEGRHYIFRLYFVDAAETEESFPGRVEEQAKYFRITTQKTVELGVLAKKFVEEKLSQPFTVRTCRQEGLGRSKKPRYYAFIGTTDGDLGELLVANGLARVHGVGATPIGLSSADVHEQKLERLEREAQQHKVGAWGAPLGRMTARVAKQPAKSGADSFDAFFHPERLIVREAAAAAPLSPATTAPAKAPGERPAGQKLDANAATSEELITIKGIGPVLAARIIAARPFKSADDLRKVKGIGPKKYGQIRPLFTDPESASQP